MDDRVKDRVALLMMGVASFSRHLDRVTELAVHQPPAELQQGLRTFFRGLVVQPATSLHDKIND